MRVVTSFVCVFFEAIYWGAEQDRCNRGGIFSWGGFTMRTGLLIGWAGKLLQFNGGWRFAKSAQRPKTGDVSCSLRPNGKNRTRPVQGTQIACFAPKINSNSQIGEGTRDIHPWWWRWHLPVGWGERRWTQRTHSVLCPVTRYFNVLVDIYPLLPGPDGLPTVGRIGGLNTVVVVGADR